jgi:hypothetical protein
MATVFLLHWHRTEAEERGSPLRDEGHTVSLHWRTDADPNLKDSLPDIAVISLDRLPSHGRAVAEWLWEAKKRQHIPIIFAGGEPDKVAVTRTKFPRAVFCATSAIRKTVTERLAAHPVATNPAQRIAPQDMATRNKRPNTYQPSPRQGQRSSPSGRRIKTTRDRKR